jgi:hypothetical protein
VRRFIAGQLHRLAWWLDRCADDIWDIDEFLAWPSIPTPLSHPEKFPQNPQKTLEDIQRDQHHERKP